MRRAAKVDDNQAEIVDALRAIGASVAITSQLGKGFPDLVVGIAGKNYLLEIKDGKKFPSQRKLTREEAAWHVEWRGQVAKVESVEQALAAIQIAGIK